MEYIMLEVYYAMPITFGISGEPSPRSWHIILERELDHIFAFGYISFLFLSKK